MNIYKEFLYNKKVFTKEEVKNIIDLYLSGLSCVKIGIKYDVSHKCILKILHKYNIDVDQKRTVRKHTLDKNYFDNIDTPNKAYILGLLYADGNNFIKKSTLSISLQEEDKDILESIRKELNSSKPLEYIDYSNKHDYGYNYKNQYRLLVFSKEICESLNKIGMKPRKSLILEFPNIHENLYSHFIRGYFDGDGSFCSCKSKNRKNQSIITFASTQSFCNTIRNILIKKLNIPGGNIYDASCHNGVTKVLSLGENSQTKTILDWLYKDAQLYLKRKHDKYIQAFYSNSSLKK